MAHLASRKKSDDSPAAPDSTTKDRRFCVGEDVYRREGEQYYLGTIVKMDVEAEMYIVKFMDGTEKPTSLKDLHKYIQAKPKCTVCKTSKPKTDDEIVECDKCGAAYHQLCHQPAAPPESAEPRARWLCGGCGQRGPPPHKSREARAKEATRRASASRILTEPKMNKQALPGSKESLRQAASVNNKTEDWGPPLHQSTVKSRLCYCGRKGGDLRKMLQCQLCQQWFHEKCLTCLTHPLYSGDRFYVFVCKLCNYGKEFVRRLELKWENIVHLAIFNLSVLQGKKYYDLETAIIPYINANWNEFQLPLKILNCSLEERRVHIRAVLTKNAHQFKCGKEIKKRTTIWALRDCAPTAAPSVHLPRNAPMSDALLKDTNKALKFLPPTYRALATGKSYLFNGQRDDVAKDLPSMIHTTDSNGLTSSCYSSDNDTAATTKMHFAKTETLSMTRDNLSITSSQFYSCGYVKKSTPFPTASQLSLEKSAARRRWKAAGGGGGKGAKGKSKLKRRNKMKHKGAKGGSSGGEKNFASRKARKLVKNAISRPKKDKMSHEDREDLPPTPPSSSAPDTPQPSISPAASTPFTLGPPLATLGDTSGDENSSRCTLDSFIPPPKDFEGKNNPFRSLTELLSSTAATGLPSSSACCAATPPITLPLPLTAVVVQQPSPQQQQRATKRQLCEKDIRIDRNGDVKRRRLRRTRSSSTVVTVTASKTATIVPGRAGEKPTVEEWTVTGSVTGRSLRSSFHNNSPSTSSGVSGVQTTNTVDYVFNGRQLRASPRLSSGGGDKKGMGGQSQPASAKSSPVKQSPVPISLDDLKSSVNMYFGAANRIAAGEKYCILAKRVTPSGKVQHLIEWEGPQT